MDKRNIFLGTALILIGSLLFANQFWGFDFFTMKYFWPLFILIPGLVFEAGFFMSGRNAGLLVPGGILTTIGLLFFFEVFTHWNFAEYTWPIYIFSVVVGLAQLYIFGSRQRGLLVPIFILTLIAAVSLFMMIFGRILTWLNYSTIIPIILVLAGVYILAGKNFNAKQ